MKVPAGAKEGTRVRLKGKGEPGRNGGPAGDLFVVVSVDKSPLYERRNADLVLDVPVTYPEATLGATVEIPTPDGPVALKVPAGTESGKLLRVKGRGAPKLKGGGKGDLLARVKVTVPQKLTKAEKEALEGYDKVLVSGHETASSVDEMPERPRYMISVAAQLAGMHPQTLRTYEAKGLVQPARTPGGTRLYSEPIRALAADPDADDQAGPQPRRGRTRASARGRAAPVRTRMEQLEARLKAEIHECTGSTGGRSWSTVPRSPRPARN